MYDKVGFDSKNASERFEEIRKKAESSQRHILNEYALYGNIDNIFEILNDKGKEKVKEHLNDIIDGKSLKEIGLDLYNNKYDTLWEKRINEFKNENPVIKDFTLEDLDLLAENYMGGKAYIESKYLYKKTTNDIVKEVIEMNKKGYDYDGVIIKNVYDYGGKVENRLPADVYVTFNSNQFKNADNTSPTSNEDIRYSLPTKEWVDYLKENYPSAGTKTKMSDIKLPTKEDINLSTTKKNLLDLPTIKKYNYLVNKSVDKIKYQYLENKTSYESIKQEYCKYKNL